MLLTKSSRFKQAAGLPATADILHRWVPTFDTVFEDASKLDPAEDGDTIIKVAPTHGSLDLEIEADDSNRAAVWLESSADLGNKPTLRFRRLAGAFSHSGYNPNNASFTDTDGPITVALVCKAPDTLRAGGSGMVLTDAENTGGALRIRLIDDGSFEMQFGSTINPWLSTTTGVISAGEKFWIIASVDGDAPDPTIHMYVNNATNDLLNVSAQSDTDLMQGIKFGSSNNYQHGWNGDTSGDPDINNNIPGHIAEIIIWNVALTPSQIFQFDAYVQKEYGIVTI